jgi:hypothetical protein
MRAVADPLEATVTLTSPGIAIPCFISRLRLRLMCHLHLRRPSLLAALLHVLCRLSCIAFRPWRLVTLGSHASIFARRC